MGKHRGIIIVFKSCPLYEINTDNTDSRRNILSNCECNDQ